MAFKSSQEARPTIVHQELCTVPLQGCTKAPTTRGKGKQKHSHKEEGTCPLKGRGCIPVNYTYGPIPSTEATVVQSTKVKIATIYY